MEQWADSDRIPPQRDAEAKLRTTLDLYPCDLLFVHRDAERETPERRRAEIQKSLKDIAVLHVPVIPVRMTEAWLLVDERAIRSAAGNPAGSEILHIPPITRLEDLLDPKQVLYGALEAASGRNARRRARFPSRERLHRIPACIDDYSVFYGLPSFQRLDRDIANFSMGSRI